MLRWNFLRCGQKVSASTTQKNRLNFPRSGAQTLRNEAETPVVRKTFIWHIFFASLLKRSIEYKNSKWANRLELEVTTSKLNNIVIYCYRSTNLWAAVYRWVFLNTQFLKEFPENGRDINCMSGAAAFCKSRQNVQNDCFVFMRHNAFSFKKGPLSETETEWCPHLYNLLFVVLVFLSVFFPATIANRPW